MGKRILRLIAAGLSMWTLSAAHAAASAETEEITGVARAFAGDAIEMAGEIFFLAGMVVPTNEHASRDHLSELVSRQKLVCEVLDVSQGSYRTANCLMNAKNVSEAMIRSGFALAFSEGGLDFSNSQSQAQGEGFGLWSQDDTGDLAIAFANGSLPPRDCAIKGNKGRKQPYVLRYHVPEAAYYGRTRINIRQGEGWFCSEAGALAAGYTASGK